MTARREVDPAWYLRDVTADRLRGYVERAGGVEEFLEECREDCLAVERTINTEALRTCVVARLGKKEREGP